MYLEVIAALHYNNRDGPIHACDFYWNHIYMLVFHQSNYASAIKRMLFYYRHISIFVFFHVFLCSMLLPCTLKSTVLRVGVKTLCNANIEFVRKKVNFVKSSKIFLS